MPVHLSQSKLKILSKTVPKFLVLRKKCSSYAILVEIEVHHHAIRVDAFHAGAARTVVFQGTLQVGLAVHGIPVDLSDDKAFGDARTHEATLTDLDDLQAALDVEAGLVVLVDRLQHQAKVGVEETLAILDHVNVTRFVK